MGEERNTIKDYRRQDERPVERTQEERPPERKKEPVRRIEVEGEAPSPKPTEAKS